MSHRVVIRKHEKIKYQKSTFFTLTHTCYDCDRYMDFHWHNSIEITYVVKGEKTTKMDNKIIKAMPGTLILVNSGISHDVKVKKGLEGIVLLIDRNYIDCHCPNVVNKRFDLNLSESARKQIVDLLLDAVKQKQLNNQILCNIRVLEIIDLMVNELLVDDYFMPEKHEDEGYEVIINVMEYLDYNYQKKITLEKLASLTNYNKAYLSSAFKKKIGITIFEYLRNVRMEHCLDDLKYGDNSIGDIALNNGFSNIQVFNRQFKELFKMTPRQYRNKSRKTI